VGESDYPTSVVYTHKGKGGKKVKEKKVLPEGSERIPLGADVTTTTDFGLGWVFSLHFSGESYYSTFYQILLPPSPSVVVVLLFLT